MGAHWPALRVVLSFFRGFAATRDKVRCGGMNVKTPARRFYNHSLVLSRLKNFVKVPGCTGFCVDTENAAVWATASSAFSVSFLAKFCTPWYLRSSELRQIQRMIHKTPCPELIYFKFPSSGILYPYRSSLKYGNPSAAGGWCSFFFRKLVNTSTMIVTTYGNALNTSCMLRPSPGI